MVTNENGQSASSAANHAPISANRRWLHGSAAAAYLRYSRINGATNVQNRRLHFPLCGSVERCLARWRPRTPRARARHGRQPRGWRTDDLADPPRGLMRADASQLLADCGGDEAHHRRVGLHAAELHVAAECLWNLRGELGPRLFVVRRHLRTGTAPRRAGACARSQWASAARQRPSSRGPR
jgi:hypothetical protein